MTGSSTVSRHHRKHAAILDAATDLFLDGGYPGTSMDEIAMRAGVSKQTVYAHFGSKEGLFLAIVDGITAFAGGGFDSVPPYIDTIEQLRAWLVRYATRQLSLVLTPEVARVRRLAIAEAMRFPDFARHFYSHGPEVTFTTIAALLEAAARSGVVNMPDPDQAARDFNWLLMADPIMRSLLLLEDEAPPAEWISARAEAAVDTLLRCLRCPD